MDDAEDPMDVRDILSSKQAPVVAIDVNDSVGGAAELMARHRVGGLPVVGGDIVRGFVSEADIVAVLAKRGAEAPRVPLGEVMRTAAICSMDENVTKVMARMTRERLRHLVVLDRGAVAGIVSVGDIVKSRLDELETERAVLRDYVAAQRAV